jgi:hypothetical protein
MMASFESKWWYRLPGRIPQASAISFSDTRIPAVAKSLAAVSRISVRRVPSVDIDPIVITGAIHKAFLPDADVHHSRRATRWEPDTSLGALCGAQPNAMSPYPGRPFRIGRVPQGNNSHHPQPMALHGLACSPARSKRPPRRPYRT